MSPEGNLKHFKLLSSVLESNYISHCSEIQALIDISRISLSGRGSYHTEPFPGVTLSSQDRQDG